MIGVPESLLDLMCVARTVSLSGCQEQGVCAGGDGKATGLAGSHVAGKRERFLMIAIS